MFTGLIITMGRVTHMTSNKEGILFTINAPTIAKELSVGNSVAVNGVCLTVISVDADSFTIQAVHVTLEKTNLSHLQIGFRVNFELALQAQDRMGGHFVQGHINGLACIKHIKPRGINYEITLAIPSELKKYMVKEGSIALDGISLTIADCSDDTIMVSIIPYTWKVTTLHEKKVNDQLNVEVDVIAKYVEHFYKYNTKILN